MALTAEQIETLVTEMAAGNTVIGVANRLRCSDRTVRRRLQDPAIRQRIITRRTEMVQMAVGKLAGAGGQAAFTLWDLLKSESETIKLGAARSVLDFMFRGTEVDLLARQVEELRQQLESKSHEPRNPSPAAGPDAGDPDPADAEPAAAAGPDRQEPRSRHARGRHAAGPVADEAAGGIVDESIGLL